MIYGILKLESVADPGFFVFENNKQANNVREELLVWGIGIFATMIGLGAFIWKIAASYTSNRADHKRIIELLEEMQAVESRLDDVLTHPNDTDFSVEPVKRELVLIREKLGRVELMLHNYVGSDEKN